MNMKNVKKLRAFIAKLPDRAVHMPSYIELDKPNETIKQAASHTCGTRACIAGWACLALLPPTARLEKNRASNPNVATTAKGKLRYVSDVAAELLGLDDGQASQLFNGDWSHKDLEMTTKADVIRELDRLIKTGVV